MKGRKERPHGRVTTNTLKCVNELTVGKTEPEVTGHAEALKTVSETTELLINPEQVKSTTISNFDLNVMTSTADIAWGTGSTLIRSSR